MQLRDKKVLLTGGSGGIGGAIAKKLAEEGAVLVLAGRNQDTLQALRRTLTPAAHDVVALALGSPEASAQIQALCQRHPDIDIVVNCAGSNLFSACDQTSAEQTRALIDLNLTGTLQLTQALLPGLLTRPDAMIVNIGSTFGSIGYPGFAVYCASKFGLRGYTEALRRELANTRVKVLYIAPRATATGMNADNVVAMNQALGNAMDTPDTVAACVTKAMQREQARLFIGWPEKIFVLLNGVFTRLVDHALKKQLPLIQRYLSQQAKS